MTAFPGTTIGSTMSAWGLQLENKSGVTSYIPTTTGQATRAADVVTLTVANNTFDILVEDTFGSEFRNSVVITTSSYTLQPRVGQNHVTRTRFWPSTGPGSLSTAQKAAIAASVPLPHPVANNDSYSATHNVLLSVATPGVLTNDTDPQGMTITVNSFDATSSHSGTVSMNSNGSFTYTSAPTFVGTDTFTYNIINSSGTISSSRATVTITVS